MGITDSSSGTKDDNAVPMWLHMNAMERKRQERNAKEKYRRENQTYYEKKTEYLSKRTGRFLSQNVLPFIKRKDTEEESNSVGDQNKETERSNNNGEYYDDDAVPLWLHQNKETERSNNNGDDYDDDAVPLWLRSNTIEQTRLQRIANENMDERVKAIAICIVKLIK